MALSPKEVEVITLVALGYSDKEICSALKIAYGTVRNHIDRAIYTHKTEPMRQWFTSLWIKNG